MRLAAFLLASSVLMAQNRPELFELQLPDFFDTPLEGGEALIELPAKPLHRLRILVRDPRDESARRVHPMKHQIFVNTKGFLNAFEELKTSEGMLFVMTPESLKMRPDDPLDPQVNVFEIHAQAGDGFKARQKWTIRVGGSERNALFGSLSGGMAEDITPLPPQLTILEPLAPIRLEASRSTTTVRLRGILSRDAALNINGKEVQIASRDQTATFDHSIEIAEDRDLILEARTSGGSYRKVIIPVSAAEASQPSRSFRGNGYAVVVGLSRLDERLVPGPMPLAQLEASELAAALSEVGAFPKENVYVHTDDAATVRRVKETLTGVITKARSEDLVIVYLAVPGVRRPGSNEVDLTLFRHKREGSAENVLPITELDLLLRQSLRTTNCLIVFDITRSRGGKPPADTLSDLLVQKYRGRTGQSVIVVDGPADAPVESGSGRSLAQWVADGVRGAADTNNDNIVVARELASFIEERARAGGNRGPLEYLLSGSRSSQ